MSEQREALLSAEGDFITAIVVDANTDMGIQLQTSRAFRSVTVGPDDIVGIGYTHDGKDFRDADGLTRAQAAEVADVVKVALAADADILKADPNDLHTLLDPIRRQAIKTVKESGKG